MGDDEQKNEEVRAEISPYFLSRSAIKDESLLTQKIIRPNGNAEFVRSGLTASPPSHPLHFLASSGCVVRSWMGLERGSLDLIKRDIRTWL